MKTMQRLTKSEEQVMLKLWQLEQATVKEILELYSGKKPAYNTTSTIVRILEKKKFIAHKKKGRGFVYRPKISKNEYRDYLCNWLKEHYFNGSNADIVSHFSRPVSLEDILGN